MGTKRQKTNPEPQEAVSLSTTAVPFSDAQEQLGLALIESCLEDDFDGVKYLVAQGADAWVQDSQGWTALHAAASVGNVAMIDHLLRSGNAVWNITDNLGFTAGDVAYSLNQAAAYEAILAEGVRYEMIRAVMGDAFGGGDASEEEDLGDEEGEETSDATPAQKLSTAGDNATFLASRLTFTTDARGQEICVDAEGNGVMMGWETEIMRRTVEELLAPFKGRKGKVFPVSKYEDEEEETLTVLNVGFGLGIVDSFLQEYSPTTHLIIEPHPDVLASARAKGWYEKPEVRFYEGTWQQYLLDLHSEKEPYLGFDAAYFDTYSEHYADLHSFFSSLPNLLLSPTSLFSFFHGLGATSRLFYDVYTEVSQLHLEEIGLKTRWEDVEVKEDVGTWEGVERRYWGAVGGYRLPVCWMEM